MSIEGIISAIIEREGEFVDHPDDKGGPTKFGITLNTLSTFRARKVTVDEVKALSRSEAFNILYEMYVKEPKFDLIVDESPKIAAELVDAGVLSGVHRPAGWLQISLNCLNNRGKDYPDIEEDGKIGPATIGALRALLAKRGLNGELVLLRMLESLQGAFFIIVAQKNIRNESFIFGWFLNRISSQYDLEVE